MTTTLKLTAAKRPFGRTGLNVTPLGFGGAPIGLLESEAEAVGDVLNELLDAGVNLIDTAACYYGSEEAIGRAVSSRRDEFVLVSKCGHNVDKDGRADFSPDVITESIDRSLKRLKTDRLDVILLHSCDLKTLKQGDALAAAVKAREAGKVRFVGYSGDNDAAAWAVQQPDVAVLQTSVNVCDQNNIDTVLPLAKKHNVGVMVKRPIANAAWKPLNEQYEKYQNYTKPYRERFEAMGLTADDFADAGLGFSSDANAAWCELFLRFTLSQPGVGVAIVGTTKPSHVRANIEIANNGPLPQKLIDRLRKAFKEAPGSKGWEGKT